MQQSVAAPLAAPAPSFFARHQFLIFRLFSLTGLMPVGAYLCVHLLTNATILNGEHGVQTYQTQVNQIHSLGVLLPVIECDFIFIPLIFHSVVGWMILSGAIPNTGAYPYPGNIRYMLQRLTAIIIFFFIILHVLEMHHLWTYLFPELGAKFKPEAASSSAAAAIRSALWVEILYAIVVLAAAFHFGNGLWTFGITWGLWTGRAAQRRASYICLAIGALLAAAGLGSLWGMITLDVDRAREIEQRMQYVQQFERGEVPTLPLTAPNQPSGYEN